MLPTLLFWLALLLPGWLLLKRFAPEALTTGMPGSLAVSWLATFTLLSPLSIGCHLLRLPVGLFAACCLAAVAASVVIIARRGWWGDVADLLFKGVCLEFALVGLDLALGARVGSFLGGGDELFHLGRIRFLLDHGISNLEPSVAEGAFLPTYHTNIVHALLAAAARILPTDYLGVWSGSIVFAKLAMAGGLHALGRAIFDRPWAAWLFVLPIFLPQAPLDYMIYPNRLAPLWVLPLVLAFAVHAIDAANPGRAAIAIASGSLVLGQIHALYAAHVGLMLAPLYAFLLVHRAWKRRPGWWRTAFLLLALGAGAPFVLGAHVGFERGPAARSTGKEATASKEASPSELAERARKAEDQGFSFEDGRVGAAILSRTIEGSPVRWLRFGGDLLAAAACQRRRQALVVVVPLAVILAVIFIEPVTVALVDRVGLLSVARLKGHLKLSFGLLPAGLALLLEPWFLRASLARPWLRERWVRAVAILLLAGSSLALHPGKEPWVVSNYWRRATAPAAERWQQLERLRATRAFLSEAIPRGATVLADFRDGQTVVMLWDAHVLLGRDGSGVPDLPQRRTDLARLTSPSLPWDQRLELLRRYGIRHALVSPRTQGQWDWLQGHVATERFSADKSWVVLTINAE